MVKMPIKWHFKFCNVVEEDLANYLFVFSLEKTRKFPFYVQERNKAPK